MFLAVKHAFVKYSGVPNFMPQRCLLISLSTKIEFFLVNCEVFVVEVYDNLLSCYCVCVFVHGARFVWGFPFLRLNSELTFSIVAGRLEVFCKD